MSFSRGPYGGGGQVSFGFPPVTPAVKQILIVLAVAFGVQSFIEIGGGAALVWNWLALVPAFIVERAAVWQLGTYALLHGGIFHLLFNLLGIYMFGGDVERVLGSREFVRFAIVCAIGGGALHTIVALVVGGAAVRVVGASGAVLGIVLAFAIFFPQRQVFIFPIPVPIKAWVMALAFGAINLYGAVNAGTGGQGGGIAFVAHLGGMAAGYLYLKLFLGRGGGGRGGGGFRFRKPKRDFRVVRGERGPYDVH